MPFDFAVVAEAVPVLLRGLEVTAIVSVIGIPLGGLAGTLAAYAVQSRSRVLAGLARGYVAMVRNVPYLILVYLSFFGLPKLGVPASAMAVAIGCSRRCTRAVTFAKSCVQRCTACRVASPAPRCRWACRAGRCSGTSSHRSCSFF